MAKERDLGQKPQGQQRMHEDRSDRESGQPLQLDNEKTNEQQHPGGEQQDHQQHPGGKR